jgi:hypothetical protein
VRSISLFLAALFISACSVDGPSVLDEVEALGNEVLVGEPVNVQFLQAVERCPIYDGNTYRQIDGARTDAIADTETKYFRIVLVTGSFDSFAEQYDDRTMDCIGELPPFDTIWVLSRDEECGLTEDHSDRAREYGLSYSSVVMERLIAERDCS